MKKITYFLFTIFALSFTSCSIYEEVTFRDNGAVSYNMSFDLSEMLKMMPNEEITPFSGDSIIAISDLIYEKIPIDNLSKEDRVDLENIAPLFLEMKSDSLTKTIAISLRGDFDNADALNKAFVSINNIKERYKDKAKSMEGADLFFSMNIYSYVWDGKTMQKSFSLQQTAYNGDDMSDEDKKIMHFLSGAKMKVKYNFPQKVKEVSNEEAMFSRDGKSVILEYPASVFIQSPETTNIKIVTE